MSVILFLHNLVMLNKELFEVMGKLQNEKLNSECKILHNERENYGWICPKCGTVNAPWMPYCGCSTQNSLSQKSTIENR